MCQMSFKLFFLVASFALGLNVETTTSTSSPSELKVYLPFDAARKLSPRENNLGPVITPLINGGTTSESFPFMVAIVQLKEGQASILCGASILTNLYILTAAHCIDGLFAIIDNGDQVEAWIAPTNLNNFDGQKIKLKQQFRFVYYQAEKGNYTHDLALLSLAEPIKMSDKVAPICIGTGNYDAEPVTMIGFGMFDCKRSSPRLLKVQGTCIGKIKCLEMGHPNNMLDSQICVVFKNDNGNPATSGKGDSGGPLFQRNNGKFILVGLVSYGYQSEGNCSFSKIPDTYTRLGSYVPFIQMFAPDTQFC